MSKQQVLMHLPDDLAAWFAARVSSRQRGRFLVELLERERARESGELAQAALALNRIEANHPALAAESGQWLESGLVEADDVGFDPVVFERQFQEAQALRSTSNSSSAATGHE